MNRASVAISEKNPEHAATTLELISEVPRSISIWTVAVLMPSDVTGGEYLFNQLTTTNFIRRCLSSLAIMNSEIITKRSDYSTVLYSAQRPPPLGTVNTDEKLAEIAREHLIKVADESRESIQSLADKG
jgi:hypothetical protein